MADKLKAPPRVARPLMGSGKLPELQNLINKSPEELMETLQRFGIEPDLKAIDRRASRAFQKLEAIIDEGIEPDEAVWQSIEASHQKEMEGSLRQMTKQAIRLYQQDKFRASEKLIWITRMTNVCPSCKPRHGKVKTYAQWRAEGLPGSAGLLCSSECRCVLVPA
jgi:hypothetical protein